MFGRITVLSFALAALAACTSSGTPTTYTTQTTTITHTSSADPNPIDTGPTRATSAESCPFVGKHYVHYTIGMRLGRVTVLRSGGRTVGCRFYALQNSYLHDSEHLPGPNQPVLQITTQRYHSAVAAHNAFVRLATAGRNALQVPLGGATGVCFQTDFYPKDAGTDWACAVNNGSTAVVVHSVDTTASFNTASVTRVVLRNV